MEVKSVLNSLGLVGKKADVYLAALELGSANVIEISKKSHIKRTTTYNVLLELIEQGMVSQAMKGKKRFFVGEAPEKILREMKNKERMFSEILPQLQSIHNSKVGKPKVRYYEGRDGLKEVYEDTLRQPGKEILGFFSYDIVDILGKEWVDDYVKRRILKGVHARAIGPNDKSLLRDYIQNDQLHRRATKLIDQQDFPFSVEIDIYGHQHVAMISAKEEIGLIIEGIEIHDTLKHLFNLVWKLLPEIDKKERFSGKQVSF